MAFYSTALTNHFSCTADSSSVTKIQTDRRKAVEGGGVSIYSIVYPLAVSAILIDTPADVPPFPVQVYIHTIFFFCIPSAHECWPKWCAN